MGCGLLGCPPKKGSRNSGSPDEKCALVKLLWEGVAHVDTPYELPFSIEKYRFIHASAHKIGDNETVRTSLLMPQALKFGTPRDYNQKIKWHVIDNSRLTVIFQGEGHQEMTVTSSKPVAWHLYSMYGME